MARPESPNPDSKEAARLLSRMADEQRQEIARQDEEDFDEEVIRRIRDWFVNSGPSSRRLI